MTMLLWLYVIVSFINNSFFFLSRFTAISSALNLFFVIKITEAVIICWLCADWIS